MNEAELIPLLQSIGNIDNRDHLDRIIEAVRRAQSHISNLQSRKFYVGQTVSFKARGRVISGMITKFLPKNIKVKLDSGMVWTVSPSLLTAV